MKNQWILCAYYTSNYKSVYEKYLEPSLVKLNLPSYIEIVEEFGSWKVNTDYKPLFVLNCLNSMGCDIVLTDVDSRINKYPILFDKIPEQYDIAAHTFRWDLHYGRPSDKGKTELLSGTLYLRNNDKVKRLVKKWIELIPDYNWEQNALQEAIKQMPDINVLNLPRKYCYISTTPRGINGGVPAVVVKDPVISHFQESRKQKRR